MLLILSWLYTTGHSIAIVLQSDDIITQNEDLEKHISLKIVKLHKKVRGLHQRN